MEGLGNKASDIGTAVNSETRGSYETGKSGAWKTWHVIPHNGTKGDRNKGIGYTSTYEPGAYRNTTAEK